MDVKSIIVSAGVALLVVVLGLSYFGPQPSVVEKIIEKVTLGAFSGPDISSDYLCVNGICTHYRNGTCLDATTTLFSILNPAGATTTVYVDRLSGFAGTSSLAVVMGTSTTSTLGLSDFPSDVWSTTTISTSTGFYRVGPGTGNNSGGRPSSPEQHIATGSIGAIIGPSDYLHVKATGTNIISQTNGAIDSLLNANNSFTCEYRVRFVR